jgi:hypothetical protein
MPISIDKTPVTIEISGLDIVALQKLSLVSHALATKLSHSAGEEQKCLATVLDDVLRRIQIARATAPARAGQGVK